MAHFGVICPELSGHLNPATTLCRELQARGHAVTFIGRPDASAKVLAAGLGFLPIGEADFPLGSMAKTSEELGRLRGLQAVKFTAEMLRRAACTVLNEAPAAVRKAGVDMLLVDQVTPAGNSVAEILGLPYITICNALAMNPDPGLPPGVMPWRYRRGLIARARNAFGHAILAYLARPIVTEINKRRASHQLPPLKRGFDANSSRAMIAQQPAFFDYPRVAPPPSFHYTGPWHDPNSGDGTSFPWEKLDGRPLIYASMGTLQNRLQHVFETIASACAGLDAQLVMSLGSREQNAAAQYDGAPVTVPFAPQLAILDKAALAITHAGLNTALESLAHGVPMVAIPITNDQPGVASRLEWIGAAEVVSLSRLSVSRLRTAIQRVLSAPEYRERARYFQGEISKLNGLSRAADIVESTMVRK